MEGMQGIVEGVGRVCQAGNCGWNEFRNYLAGVREPDMMSKG